MEKNQVFPNPGTQMSFISGLSSGSLKIPEVGTPTNLKAHNFVWRPPIELRFKSKL